MINHTNSCSFFKYILNKFFCLRGYIHHLFATSGFDESINFLRVFWTLVRLFSFGQMCCICCGVTLRLSLQETNLERVRWCCNSPRFTTQCTPSTVINSESGTSYIFLLHIYLCLLSLIILSSPNLVCSCLSKGNWFHMSPSVFTPFYVYFTQFSGLNSQSFPLLAHHVHSVVQELQLDINLPLMSPTHHMAHGCSGIG